MNTNLDNNFNDDNYFELEDREDNIENEQESDDDSLEDEYEEDESENDDEIGDDSDYDDEPEDDDNEYDGYSIGYFTVNNNSEVAETDEPTLIRLMEDFMDTDESNIYDDMLDDINSDENIDEVEDDESDMYDDPDFKNAIYMNSELEEFNESFTSVKNPYFALNALRDFLFQFNLILPHFDLPSNYDEWVFDVTLDNKSEYSQSKYICHIEILCGEKENCYSVNAGVYPK